MCFIHLFVHGDGKVPLWLHDDNVCAEGKQCMHKQKQVVFVEQKVEHISDF